jgi:hypothetical protein
MGTGADTSGLGRSKPPRQRSPDLAAATSPRRRGQSPRPWGVSLRHGTPEARLVVRVNPHAPVGPLDSPRGPQTGGLKITPHAPLA